MWPGIAQPPTPDVKPVLLGVLPPVAGADMTRSLSNHAGDANDEFMQAFREAADFSVFGGNGNGNGGDAPGPYTFLHGTHADVDIASWQAGVDELRRGQDA